MNFHWYLSEMSTGFLIDFHWYFIEISIEFQLDFQWISYGISLKFQLDWTQMHDWASREEYKQLSLGSGV